MYTERLSLQGLGGYDGGYDSGGDVIGGNGSGYSVVGGGGGGSGYSVVGGGGSSGYSVVGGGGGGSGYSVVGGGRRELSGSQNALDPAGGGHTTRSASKSPVLGRTDKQS